MSIGWIIGLILVTIGGLSFWLTWRMIDEPGQHAGKVFADGAERPLFRGERSFDQLDRLAARYYMPERALEELDRVDELLAEIDAILRPVTAR